MDTPELQEVVDAPRERLDVEYNTVAGIEWILPDRPLAPEYAMVLGIDSLRGADL